MLTHRVLAALRFVLPVVILVAAEAPSAAIAGDWPQWRGVGRDGHSTDTGLLKAWPKGGPKLVWKITGVGIGYSSLAVADGRIYTLGDGKDRSALVAMDLDGKRLWSTPIGKTGGNYAGTRSTPTVDGALVYALGQFGDLVCADAKTGAEKWRRNLEKEFAGQVGGWNYAESPLVDGNLLVCAPGGSRGAVVALDKMTGQAVWRTEDYKDHAEYTSIIAAEIGGQKQYVHFSDQNLVGISPDTGRVLWSVKRQGSTAVITTPIVADNMVYVTSGYGVGCNLFKISKSGSKFVAEQLYEGKDMVNHHGGVVKVGDYVYGYSDGKGWVCQEFKSGAMKWKSKELGKGSIAYADGMLYLRSEDGKGTVALVEATPDGWREKGRFDQPDRSGQNSWSHPVIANGRLYLRDMDVLLAYDVKA